MEKGDFFLKIKKLLSIILSITIIISTVTIGCYVYADDIETDNIENFVDEVTEIISTYDADKEFVVSPEEPEIVKQNDDPTVWEPTIFEENEEREIFLEPNFQSCRLIVKQSKRFDDKNAAAVADGFGDYHIVQFENEKDTEEAYYKYLEDKDVSSVSVDEAVNIVFDDYDYDDETPEIFEKDLTDNLYRDAIGISDYFKYCADSLDTDTIVNVAVIDTGVDLNNKYLKDRLIETGYSGFPDEDTEQDSKDGHGTMVSSVIAANTPDNVKISNYKIIQGNTVPTILYICATFLKAYSDGCNIINCSFDLIKESKEYVDILNSTLKELYDNDCFICSAAGNNGWFLDLANLWPIESSDYTFAVGASNQYNVPASFTNYGENVELLAPGVDIPVATLNNEYTLDSGTSFSAPIITALYALLELSYPDTTMAEKERMLKGSTTKVDTPYCTGYFGTGIIDVKKLFDIYNISAPEINIISSNDILGTNKYLGDVTVELTDNDNCDIYYTLDDTYPSLTNGIKYNEPFVLPEDDYYDLRAVAIDKNGFRSEYIYKEIHCAKLETDDMFTIDGDGIITSYTGHLNYIKIPETINGIEVKDIGQYVFSDADFIGVVLPTTITNLGGSFNRHIPNRFDGYESYAFYSNKVVEYITGLSLITINDYAFYNTESLYEVEFPKLENLGRHVFHFSEISGLTLPNLKTCAEYSLEHALLLREFIAPNLKEVKINAFRELGSLTLFYAPDFICGFSLYSERGDGEELFNYCERLSNNKLVLNNVTSLKSITKGINADPLFYDCGLKRLELSSIQYIDSLPANYHITTSYSSRHIYSTMFGTTDISVVLPSTLNYCINPYEHYSVDEYTHYIVYGSSENSYLQEWAKEVGADFIELNEKTAIVEDVYPIYDRFSKEQLYFDCYGFNKQYQWYGSYRNDTKNGIALDGATDEEFSPEDYPYYPYYYCVMTSTDKDRNGDVVEKLDVYSTVCENLLYNYPSADYTEYDKAVEKAKSLDKSLYKDFSKVEKALAVDVSGKTAKEQDIVDAQTKAILDAIANLELIENTTAPSKPSTKPSEPSTKPTEPSTTKPSESSSSTTKPSTATEQTVSEKETTKAVKHNTSKTSPNTGADNNSIPLTIGFALVFIVFISAIGSEQKRRKN